VARLLLRRFGVVFRRVIAREKAPVPWRDLARVYRALEARGEIRGGRFVGGFAGEQYALPEAVTLLRSVRRRGSRSGEGDGNGNGHDDRLPPLEVAAADPLNLRGILTPEERIPPASRRRVVVA
jgi:ATP-dependent Lhr-like helicase